MTKARATYVRVQHWDVWVGPGPEPVTGRKLSAARWGLSVEGDTDADRLAKWLRRMEHDKARVERARLELEGLVLGCSCPAPWCRAHALAEIVNGREPAEIREELEASGVLSTTKPLFEEAR